MKNITLNWGGLIGAFLGAGGLVAVVYVVFLFLADGNHAPRWIGKLFFLGLVGGAVVGNHLWGLIFPSKQDSCGDDDVTRKQ